MVKPEEIKHRKINQKSIRRFLEVENLKNAEDFNELRSSRHLLDPSFLHHSMEFKIDASLQNVWNMYLQIGPRDTWDEGFMSYGFTYNGRQGSFNYLDDEYRGLEEGQILFLNLRLLAGLISLTVMHKVIEINEAKKYLFISYLEKNKSLGTQYISFREENGITIVRHKTRYKSDSKFRDRFIYPIFHSIIIKRFHQTIFKALIESRV